MGKIVAIGGGENGKINSKGEKLPYELAEIDEEIIRLSGKQKPYVLRSYRKNGVIVEEERRESDGYKELSRLLSLG